MCSQINANKDVNGSAASSAATPEFRLAISDMAVIKTAEIAIFMR